VLMTDPLCLSGVEPTVETTEPSSVV